MRIQRELVTQKYKEYRDTYYKTEKQLKYMKATVEYLAGMLDLRNELSGGAEPCRAMSQDTTCHPPAGSTLLLCHHGCRHIEADA